MMDFKDLSSKEWLEANGLGGYASGTFSGAHTRRYHGLAGWPALPALHRALMVLLSKLDETLLSGLERFELGCNQYPGVLSPAGYQYLESYSRELFPVFEYRCGTVRLRKTVAALHDENSSLDLLKHWRPPRPVSLEASSSS